ncbi:unnamed protein product [Strongylus vulgaris]|uniref:Uncharacterized protein n=1 Tax=Strongylus vulgaris TaxID=40348 RepID=A0A3P7JZ91_STRVU|nr:unnamed protein product [Strongylus vulgaris]
MSELHVGTPEALLQRERQPRTGRRERLQKSVRSLRPEKNTLCPVARRRQPWVREHGTAAIVSSLSSLPGPHAFPTSRFPTTPHRNASICLIMLFMCKIKAVDVFGMNY